MLPELFVERVLRDLGPEDGAALCAALDGNPPAPVSVRVNPDKGYEVPDGVAVGWSRYGRYLSRRPSFTLDPLFHAGAYYVQEASSQFVGRLVDLFGGAAGGRILDLCAAPGGKTTLYATLAGPDGLVVANEVVRNRAAVLADNVRKWGLGNVVVTVNDPSRVALFERWFDVVAVDAPCSGEGMFRKSEEARSEWSESGIAACAVRQQQILRRAWQCLRPGGLLIYSTCTFNRTENEDTVSAFAAWAADGIAEAPEVPVDPSWGVVCGRAGVFRTFRFYPHRASGEGFFAAVACKSAGAEARSRRPRPVRAPMSAVDRAAERELARWVVSPEAMRFLAAGDTCYGIRASQFEAVKQLAGTLNVIASGVEMGTIFKGRLRPAHGLALYCGIRRDAVARAELSEEEAVRYLRRQPVDPAPFAEGIGLVEFGGFPIGWVKRIGSRCNNMYPASLRIIKS